MVDSKKRISLADLLKGLEQDEVYGVDCRILLQKSVDKHHLKILDPDSVPECLRVLVDIWLKYEHLSLYHHESREEVVFNNGIQSRGVLSRDYDSDYEVDKGDLQKLLFGLGFPLPAPKSKAQDSFWFYDHPFSTEKNTMESIAAAGEAQEKIRHKGRQKGLAFHVADRITDKKTLKSCALWLGGVRIPDGVDPKLVELYATRKLLEIVAKKDFEVEPTEAKRRSFKKNIERINKQINGGQPYEELEVQPSSDNSPLAADNTANRAEQHFSTLPGTEWRDISIRFVTIEKVEVTFEGKSRERNFKSLGFKDKKQKGKDTWNKAWHYFFLLAVHQGDIELPPSGKERDNVVKQVANIKKQLKNLFPNVVGDPFKTRQKDKGWPLRISLSSPRDLRLLS